MNIVLTGFMCTGKTSVGKLLAEKLGYQFVDTDDLIEQRVGMKISDIFAVYGEPYFRDVETEVVKEVAKKDKFVISTGGGVVLRKVNMNELRKKGIIVNLTAKPETIYNRLKNQHGVRPLLNKPDPMNEIIKLLSQREEYYKNCDLRIETDNFTVEQIVQQILDYIKTK
jgi:shikimate kinase